MPSHHHLTLLFTHSSSQLVSSSSRSSMSLLATHSFCVFFFFSLFLVVEFLHEVSDHCLLSFWSSSMITVDGTSMRVTPTPTVTWPGQLATSSSHPVQGQVFFLPCKHFVEFCYSLGFGTTAVSGDSWDSVDFLVVAPLQTIVIRFAHAPFTVLLSCSRVCPVLHLSSPIQTTVSTLHECNIISPGGTSTITVVAERRPWVEGRSVSLRRWTLDLRTMSWRLHQWTSNPISRTMTKHPRSLVPSRASSRVIVRKWNCGFCSRALQLSYKGPRVLSRLTGPSLGCLRRTGTRGCGYYRWSERDPGYAGGSFPGWTWNGTFRCLGGHFLWTWQEEGWEAPRLCTSGTKQRTRAGQARSTAARPSTGISSAAQSEPGHSSTHCHHDTGRQQLAIWRCEEGVQALCWWVFARPEGTRRTRATHSPVYHRQKKQVLRQRNGKETLTWKLPLRPWPRKATSIWKKPMFKGYCWLTKSHDSCVEKNGRTAATDPWQGALVEGNLVELRVDSTSKSWSHAHVAASVARRDNGHATAQIKENKCPDGEQVKTLFFVYFGGDHSTPGYIGKGVIDTGCTRFLIGQNYSRKVGTDAHKMMGSEHAEGPARRRPWPSVFGNDETLETRTLAIFLVGIAGVNGILRVHVHVVPGGAPLLLSKEFLRELGCHIALGRVARLFFEKLGVRAVVTSEQTPHLLPPLTSFGPQGHKIAAEIQPRISSDECAIYRATCDSSETEQNTFVDRLSIWPQSTRNW